MRQRPQATFSALRFYLITFLILFVVAGLIARMIDLTVIDRQFLRAQGDARILRTIEIPAFRGMVTDRNGFPLAISTSVYSVWMNPIEFEFNNEDVSELLKILGLKPNTLKVIAKNNQDLNREFIYLKRNLSPEKAKQIKALHLPGIYLLQGYKRYYPESEIAAHLIGFTNVDDQGQEGLELIYNDWLAGSAGKKLVIKDRLGREISNLRTIREQKSGHDLTLSIDKRIQYIAYRELLAGIQKNLATSGTVVVLDVKTGEVLAMANFPSFNPNNRVSGSSENFRNRAVTDVFEPGSTMKAFSVATAFASGQFKPDTIINTYPGWLRVGRHLVTDEHRKGPMTIREILQVSSNVGVTKMILTLPPEKLWKFLHDLGFGEATGIGFPGERSGFLTKKTKWDPFTVATLSWGYGVSVTPLQLAAAYSVLAAGGVKVPLSLLKLDGEAPKGKRVMTKQLADEMLGVLESVVEGGTGTLAKVPGYRVAGKTGTSRMLGVEGYQKNHHVSTFVGIAPVSNPRLVVAVVMHDPQGKVFLAQFVAAPVFQKIMEDSLRILNVPPDQIINNSPLPAKRGEG